MNESEEEEQVEDDETEEKAVYDSIFQKEDAVPHIPAT